MLFPTTVVLPSTARSLQVFARPACAGSVSSDADSEAFNPTYHPSLEYALDATGFTFLSSAWCGTAAALSPASTDVAQAATAYHMLGYAALAGGVIGGILGRELMQVASRCAGHTPGQEERTAGFCVGASLGVFTAAGGVLLHSLAGASPGLCAGIGGATCLALLGAAHAQQKIVAYLHSAHAS